MPLKKILFKPGVNRENTRYTTEGGWYDCDKVRFRQGTPEKLGGWEPISINSYEGVCRSLWTWSTLGGVIQTGVGTNLKFYIEQGGFYYDITPIRAFENALANPFTAIEPQTFTVTVASPAVMTASSLATITNGMAFTFTTTGSLPTGLATGVTYYAVNSASNTCRLALTPGGNPIVTTGTQSGMHTLTSTTVTVSDTNHGATDGDYVTFFGAEALSEQVFTPIELTGVDITGTAGEFSCTAASLAVDQAITISGVFGGTGSITGYSNPKTYYIIATNGSTTFTLSATLGGAAITTTAGTPTGLTYVNATNFVLSSALPTNTPVILSSTGVLPDGLVAGVQYYILVVSGTTVQLTNNVGGAAITISDIGSGTYSLYVNQGITAAVLNQTYAITFVGVNSYTINVSTAATAYDTGNGGTVNLFYEVPVGYAIAQPLSGWGSGAWGYGTWGLSQTSTQTARLWYQSNFGEDLVFGYRGGPLYYWNSSPGPAGLSTTIALNSQTVSSVDTGTEYITTASAVANSTPVKLTSTGSLPTPLLDGTVYYVINSGGGGSANTCQLALAPLGSAINITTAGSGTISLFTAATFTIAGVAYDGQTVQLESTGTLPTGMTIGTIYYIQNFVGSSFNLAATATGQSLILTGTQSGVHTLLPNGVPLTELAYASHVPAAANFVAVSDASRFTIAFGTVPYDPTSADPTTDSGTLDPMLIRWSDQESVTEWAPAVTNQAGFIRLSHGSEIRNTIQTRQEIVVFTDSTLYSLQYLGAPYVWGSQILGDNISIAGYNTTSLASGVVYWMGTDKFYKYDGRVQTLRCDLRQYIYQDINLEQQSQFFSGTNEGFSEVWWFYCSANSTTIDKYVVYNYLEDAWYYGTMARTAWLDSGLIQYPQAATYNENIVLHELGNDDNTTGTPAAIDAYITSSEFDIGDGHNFGFIWRLLPDVTFRGSSVASPAQPTVTMYMIPLQNSGSGYTTPPSVGGSDNEPVIQTRPPTAVQVEEFTGQINVRVRGRQMSFKIASDQLGCQWQLGSPRMDIRSDGRR